MDVAEARDLYEIVTEIEEFAHSLQIGLDHPDRDTLMTAMIRAAGECQLDEQRSVIMALSPWHAFFVLWAALALARADRSTVFFRGQADVQLKHLSAGIFRDLSVEAAEQALRAVAIIEHLLEKKEIVHQEDDDLPNLARAIAQHYGVATSLLDVTLDPAVAIYFALLDTTRERGAAFALDWKHCEEQSLPIVIPPVAAWSKRLIDQRGFFLDLERIQRLGVQQTYYTVEFPRLDGFEVRRCGEVVRPWPIDEPEVEKMIAWAKQAFNGVSDAASITNLVDGYAGKRDLLNYQFERMFGFRPGSNFAPGAGQLAIKQYLLESFFHIERFVNHLCLDPDGFSRDRLLRVRDANRGVFRIYLEQVRSGRARGQFHDRNHDQLLEILDVM